MRKVSYIILFILTALLLAAEKVPLVEEWQYSREGLDSGAKWQPFALGASMEEQGIRLEKGDIIYYRYNFKRSDIEGLLRSGKDVGIYLGKIDGMTEVYLNGHKLTDSRFDARIIYFRLIPSIVTEENSLSLKVTKNVAMFSGKFNNSFPYVDSYENIIMHFYFIYMLLLIIAGSTFLIGIFFLFFFHHRLNNVQYILYFFMCTCCALYTLLKSPYKLYLIEQMGFDWFWLEKAVFSTLYFLPFIGVLFLINIYREKGPVFRTICIGHGVVTAGFTIIALFTNFELMTRSLPFYSIFTFFSILLYFTLTIRQVVKRVKYVVNILVGLVVLSFFIIFDMAVVLNLYEYLDKFPFFAVGFFFFIFMIGLYLSRQFVKVNLDLRDVNSNLEQKVRERTEELKGALNFKSNLLTTTAHHTRTPLTLIRNGLDSLFRSNPELEENRELAIIRRNAELLTRDIVNIFDLDQSEQGKGLFENREIFDLTAMLRDKAVIFRKTAGLKGISIVTIIADGVQIKANDLAINRVIDNLLDNAIKYCHEGAEIKLSLVERGDKLVMTVADNGPGIAESDLNNLFDRYYQSGRDKTFSPGLGLGLALTKEIVESMEGTISVESKVGEGALFRVVLPSTAPGEKSELVNYRVTEPLQPAIEYEEQTEIKQELKTVLVVEDEVELLHYFSEAFGGYYNIVTANNGRVALERLESVKPDLIISDIMMPQMDGLEFKESLPESCRSIPFIYITAMTKESDKLAGLAKGADDYIYKPFRFEEVKMKIERHLQARESREQEVIERILQAAGREKERFIEKQPGFEERCEQCGLTRREMEIVRILKESGSNQEAADKLFISLSTIKSHIKNIFKKTEVTSQKELFKKLF